MNNICVKKLNGWGTYGILLIVAFLFVFLFSTTTSPLYLNNPFWWMGDSGIFQEFGLLLLEGGTPYIDIFDHKGPVLFFIQALGLGINRTWGLCLLQTMSLAIALFFMKKIMSLFDVRGLVSYLLLLLILFFLFSYYERGNLCEEWCLPYLCYTFYIFLRYIVKESRISTWEYFICGLCLGMIFFIRANNAVPPIGLLLYFLYDRIKKKDVFLITDILKMIGGFTIVCIPILFFYYNKAGVTGIEEMIYGTFLFNFDYVTKSIDLGTWKNIVYYSSIASFSLLTLLLFPKVNAKLFIPLVASYLCCGFAIGGFKALHYLQIFIPLYIVTLCLLVNQGNKWLWLLLVIPIAHCVSGGYSSFDRLIVKLRGIEVPRNSHDDFHRFVVSLPEHERTEIYNLYGYPLYFFVEEDLVQCNRFVMSRHLDLSPRLRTYDEIHGIAERKPTWVLANDLSSLNRENKQYLINNYIITDSIIGNFDLGYVYCYRRNDK